MINGPFGVGKTTVSNELLNEINNSMIFDPEEVGFMLRNIIPIDIKLLEATAGDFQDLKMWKELTVIVAKLLVEKYKKHLIVPMTIRNVEYFQYIFEGFKRIDQDTFHFCLIAKKETIFKRLIERGEKEGDWCFQQTKKCLQAYRDNDFGVYINTENLSIETIVLEIIQSLSNRYIQ